MYRVSSRSPVDDGIITLSRMLRNNLSLKRMKVGVGAVSREAVCALVGALQDNQTLEDLELYSGYSELFSDTERDEMDPRVSFKW